MHLRHIDEEHDRLYTAPDTLATEAENNDKCYPEIIRQTDKVAVGKQ